MPTFKDKKGRLHRRGAASRYAAEGRKGETKVQPAPAKTDDKPKG